MQRLRSLAAVQQLGSLAASLALSLALAAAAATPCAAAADLPPGPAAKRPAVDVVFVLDATGSMSGLIEGAKQKIWSIANHIASARGEPHVRIGLVGYRDRGDEWVTRRLPLSDDIDAVYAELRGFTAQGGGDGPESVNQALHEAVMRMPWRDGEDVYRVVFLVGDAPPHLDYPDDVPYPASLAEAARRGIVVNAIQCGTFAETTRVWREIARRGEGEYAMIDQSGGMVAIATPVDEELEALQGALAATALPWGTAEEQTALADKLDAARSAPSAVAAERLGYMQRAGGTLVGGRSDLVDAASAGAVDPAVLPEDALPAELRDLDAEGRRAWVARKGEEREAYVRAEKERLAREGHGDGFDAKVAETIREQAAEKGITWE